jgi:hypothetical protein
MSPPSSGFFLGVFSYLKTEATCSSETSVADQRTTTRRYISEDRTLQAVSSFMFCSHCLILLKPPARLRPKKIPDFYSKGQGFKYRSVHLLSSLRCFVIFSQFHPGNYRDTEINPLPLPSPQPPVHYTGILLV